MLFDLEKASFLLHSWVCSGWQNLVFGGRLRIVDAPSHEDSPPPLRAPPRVQVGEVCGIDVKAHILLLACMGVCTIREVCSCVSLNDVV